MNKAEEFKQKNYSDVHGIYYDNKGNEVTWYEIAEAYLQHRVNAISDEDIESHVNSHIGIFDRKVGFRKGIFWLKEQLLKQ